MTAVTARTAVIIGAGGGIGAACCKSFAAAGYRIVAADLRQDAAVAAIAAVGERSEAHRLDVTDAAAVATFAAAVSADGSIDALVYAPGLVMTSKIDETDWARYRNLMAVNLDGAFYVAASFARPIRAARGSLTFISSTAGRRGEAGASAYCASKFGLIGLAESLAAEFAPDGARVNAVCPGNVDTPMLDQVSRDIARSRGVSSDEVWRMLTNTGAATRLVRPEEVAELCVALANPGLSAVTGATVTVDAGASVG